MIGSHVADRLRPQRRALWIVAAVTVLAAALLLIVALVSNGPSRSGPVLGSLGGKALPQGPPAIGTSEALTERVTLARMLSDAPIVFIGRVEEIGGSEVVSPSADAGLGSRSSHRTRLSVIDQFRGPTADRIDVSLLDLEQFSDVFAVGERYLIFAEWRELGTLNTRALVPSGYDQGVYRMVSDVEATNPVNGEVNIDSIGLGRNGADQ